MIIPLPNVYESP